MLKLHLRILVIATLCGAMLAACDDSSAPHAQNTNRRAEANAMAANHTVPAPHRHIPDQNPSKQILTFHSLGAVQLGMSVAEASAAYGKKLVVPTNPDPECSYAFAPPGPPGIGFMLHEGKIVRIDVTKPGIQTPKGAHIGGTEVNLLRLYAPAAKVSPQKYTDGHNVTVTSPDPGESGLRLVFQTSAGRITAMRAGRLPQVGFAEGCS